MRFAIATLLLTLIAAPAAAQAPPAPRYLPGWAVRTAAESGLDSVHACYVKHVPAESRVGNGDNARVNFMFAPSGAVDSVSFADTTVTQSDARDCILAALRGVRAPITSERPTEVVVWFGLSSGRETTTVKVESDPNQRLTSKAVVDRARTKMDLYMKCYTDRLDARPDLSGTVKFEITVGADGRVSSVKVLESLDGQVDECISGHIRALSFPAPGKDAPVIATLPITFKTK